MTETKRPLKVFLCHAHADRDRVRALYTRLTKDGVNAWLDKESLLPGQDWELEIRKAVREADVVVVCLSKQFNQAGFRQKEVRLALDTAMEKPEGEIFIIPARLEECDSLESLRKWHWVSLFEEDGHEKLLHALYSRSEKIGAITYSLRKSDVLAERVRQVSFLRSQALKLEDNSDWGSALGLYRQIKRLDSNAVGVDEKITILILKTQYQQLDANKKKATQRTLSGIALIGVGVMMFCCLFAFAGGGWYVWSNRLIGAIPTETALSEETDGLAVTQPSIQTKTVIPNSATVVDDEMAFIPAGEFMMGSEDGVESDERPVHQIFLDAYYLDIYEVTNIAYKRCVDAGECAPPKQNNSYTHSSYYGNSEFDKHPVINVDWNMAKIYCEWRGAMLPTEAQWEKAARGTDGRTYPWGNTFNGTYVNFCDKNCSFNWSNKNEDDGYSDTAPVGSYESGKSSYGIYDLAGNVWEWVADWYASNYYANSSDANPLGSSSGQYRVLRGGSWSSFININDLRSADRYWYAPDGFDLHIGFRCARSVP